MPANINIDPSISLGVKQTDALTNLSNLLNMGNAAQQFQQARELNPLQIQQKQMEIEQAQKVNPLLVRQQSQSANQSEILTEKNAMELAAKKAKAIHDSQISLINNPLVLQAEKNPASLNDEAKQKLYKLIESSGLNQAKALGMDEAKARELMKPTLDIAASNPAGLRQLFKERHIESLDAASRTGALSASGVDVTTGAGGMKVQTGEFGPVKPGEIIKGTSYVQQLGPGQTQTITKDATGKDVIVVRDANGTITGVLPMPNQPPPNAPVPRGGNAQTAPSAPVTPVNSEMPQMRYQRRDYNLPQTAIPPDEKVAYEDGIKTVKSLRDGAAELTAAKNNLTNVIKTATGLQEGALPSSGAIGSWVRTVRNWAGDPTYKTLSKELANVQIAQIKSSGGSMDTVAGQQLSKYANGDETYPPEVLIKISNESFANILNTEMQADAADKFVRKFGEANIGSFKDLWRKNSDIKAFQLLNLNKDSEGLNKNSPEYKKIKLQTDSLLGPNPTKRQELIKKITNLQKLTNNGEL
jgi:hypothetical protein